MSCIFALTKSAKDTIVSHLWFLVASKYILDHYFNILPILRKEMPDLMSFKDLIIVGNRDEYKYIRIYTINFHQSEMHYFDWIIEIHQLSTLV